MPKWKEILLKAIGYGAGITLALVLVAVTGYYYLQRRTPPRPWNAGAIKASFYSVQTTGESKQLQFEYVLENTTDSDYSVEAYSTPRIAAMLEDTNILTGFAGNDITLKLPIYIPAHKRTRIDITLPAYGVPTIVEPGESASEEERQKYHVEVAAYVTKRLGNLNGFVIFDESQRYEIDLPNGWKSIAEANEKSPPKQR